MDILFSEWIVICEALAFQKKIDILVEQFVDSFLEGLAPDEQALLVQKARAGDWEPLVGYYQPQLVMWLQGMGLQNADAQDVAQNAIIQLFNKLPTLQDPEKLEGWLRMIASNAFKNSFRKKKDKPESSFAKRGAEEMGIEDLGMSSRRGKFTPVSDDPGYNLPGRNRERSPVSIAMKREEEPLRAAAIQPFIDELKEKNPLAHQIVSMFTNDGKTFEQIGEELGMDVAKVQTMFDTAIKSISLSSGVDIEKSNLGVGRMPVHSAKVTDIPGIEAGIEWLTSEFPRHAQILKMKRDGMKYSEIAQNLKMDINQVKGQYFTALRKIGKHLDLPPEVMARLR